MVLTPKTQIEMYEYLSNKGTSGVISVDSDSNEFLTSAIKKLATKVNRVCNLFNRQALIKDGKMELDYNSDSNHLIYYVLNNIGGCAMLLKEINTYKKAINNFKKIPKDIKYVRDTNNKLRDRLINLCKLYLDNQEYEIASKKKCTDIEFISKESWLAEKCLHTYSKKHFAIFGNLLRHRTAISYALRSDIVIEGAVKTIIVDVKVYSNIVSKDDKLYISNNNKNQINSYIGAYLSKTNHKNNNVEGIVLHIVSSEQYEKAKHLNGGDLSVEDDRKLSLYIIEDKGLNYILDTYKEIIETRLVDKTSYTNNENLT